MLDAWQSFTGTRLLVISSEQCYSTITVYRKPPNRNFLSHSTMCDAMASSLCYPVYVDVRLPLCSTVYAMLPLLPSSWYTCRMWWCLYIFHNPAGLDLDWWVTDTTSDHYVCVCYLTFGVQDCKTVCSSAIVLPTSGYTSKTVPVCALFLLL